MSFFRNPKSLSAFVKIFIILAFLLNSNGIPPLSANILHITPGQLNVWTATENIAVNRQILSRMYRDHRLIWIANSERYQKLLEKFSAPALVLSSGRYLVSEATAQDDLLLIRAVTHEDYEVLMQKEMKERPERYVGLMSTVLNDSEIMALYYRLSDFDPEKRHFYTHVFLFNDLISKAFEIRTLLEKHLVRHSSLSEDERAFYGQLKPLIEGAAPSGERIFPEAFFDIDLRLSIVWELQNDPTERFEMTASWLSKMFGGDNTDNTPLFEQLSQLTSSVTVDRFKKDFATYTPSELKGYLERIIALVQVLKENGISVKNVLYNGVPHMTKMGVIADKLDPLFRLGGVLAKKGMDPARSFQYISDCMKKLDVSPDYWDEFFNMALDMAERGKDPGDIFAEAYSSAGDMEMLERALKKADENYEKKKEAERKRAERKANEERIKRERREKLAKQEAEREEQARLRAEKEKEKAAKKPARKKPAPKIPKAPLKPLTNTDTLLNEVYEVDMISSLAREIAEMHKAEEPKNEEEGEEQSQAPYRIRMKKPDYSDILKAFDEISDLYYPESRKKTPLEELQHKFAGRVIDYDPLALEAAISNVLDEFAPEKIDALLQGVRSLTYINRLKSIFTPPDKGRSPLIDEILENAPPTEKDLRLERQHALCNRLFDALGSMQFTGKEEDINVLLGFLGSIASDNLEQPVNVRQAAVTVLRKIPTDEAREIEKNAMEDPDMLNREVKIGKEASIEEATEKIIDGIQWLAGEKETEKDLPAVRANIAYLFDQNPDILDFLHKYPLRLFSMKDKQKIDSCVLGDFRRYWFQILGLIYFHYSYMDNSYKEYARRLELRHRDSVVDMGIAIEVFRNKYLLASVIYHEYLHYKGIHSEGEARLRQMTYMKGLIAEDMLAADSAERERLEQELASAIVNSGLGNIGEDLIFNLDDKNVLEFYIDKFNGLIEKLYGPDDMSPDKMEAEADKILSEMENYIARRNQALEAERQLDPSKTLFEPVGEVVKYQIRKLIQKSKHVNNKLTRWRFKSILRDMRRQRKQWARYKALGGDKSLAQQLSIAEGRLVVQRLKGLPPGSVLKVIKTESGETVYLASDEDKGGSSIGKYARVSIEGMTEKEEGVLEITAVIKGLGPDEEEKTVTLRGRRAPFNELPEIAKTGITELDDIIERTQRTVRDFKNRNVIILEGNDHLLQGIAATFGNAPFLALEDSIFSNPVACFHEMAHMANEWGFTTSEDVLKHITDRAVLESSYLDKLEKYGYVPETAPETVKFHYALRALQDQYFGSMDQALTALIKTPVINPLNLSAVKREFSLLDRIVRQSRLGALVSALGPLARKNSGISRLHLCIPAAVFKNSPDLKAVLARICGMRKDLAFSLVVTGADKEDSEVIDKLNSKAVKDPLGITENIQITAITAEEINKRAVMLDQDAADAGIRTGIIKDLYLETIGEQQLRPGEYLAIATEPVSKDGTQQLEEQLKEELDENISISILVRPDPRESMFSLSEILNQWLSSIHKGDASNISIILPPILSPAEMIRRLSEATRNVWKTLIAA